MTKFLIVLGVMLATASAGIYLLGLGAAVLLRAAGPSDDDGEGRF